MFITTEPIVAEATLTEDDLAGLSRAELATLVLASDQVIQSLYAQKLDLLRVCDAMELGLELKDQRIAYQEEALGVYDRVADYAEVAYGMTLQSLIAEADAAWFRSGSDWDFMPATDSESDDAPF